MSAAVERMDAASRGLDAASLRRAFAHYPTGVAVITAAATDGPVGMVVSSFVSVSLAPPLVAFCAATESSTWSSVAAIGRCCVNVLSGEQEALSAQMFRRGGERSSGVEHGPAPSGAPILAGAVAWFDCRIVQTHPAGDHELVVLEVRAHDGVVGREPLVFHRSSYRRFPARASDDSGGDIEPASCSV